MAKKKKVQTDEKDLLGVEKYYNKYANWAVNVPRSKGIGIVVTGLIISAILIVGTIMLSFLPQWSIPLLTWPIGLFLFLAGLAVAIRRANNDEDIITVKERFSFRQRVKIATIVTIVFVGILLSVSSYIPNSIGGAATIVYVLSAINTIRRTPEEVEMSQLGIIDERDITEEDIDEERARYFAEEYEEDPDQLIEELDDLDDYDNREGKTLR